MKMKECYDYKHQFITIQNDYEGLEKKYQDGVETINQLNQDVEDKDGVIDNLKLDINRKEEELDKAGIEITNLNGEIERLKDELTISQNELAKKTEKLLDLQHKYADLEQEYIDYKTKTSSELYGLRDFKQVNESLKSTHYEVKNQYEVLSLKFQSVSDDNFNLRRDLLLYEKELKTKSEAIERLRNEVLEKRRENNYSTDVGGSYGEANNTAYSSLNYFTHGKKISKEINYDSVEKEEKKETKKQKAKYYEDDVKEESGDRVKLLETKLYNMNLEREKVCLVLTFLDLR
jgi:predicted  nucleic acid-binding Zn-ribbon protein